MNLRKWLFLFITTLALGGITNAVVRLSIDFGGITSETTVVDALLVFILLFVIGAAFSAISQMAYFAYLSLHRIFLGMFKYRLWRDIQIFLIAFVFFDLVYLRYIFFAEGESWLYYLILPTILLLASLPVAILKAKETNKQTLIPSIFLLFVVTTISALPALMAGDVTWILMMMITLFVCFAWQLIMLHRLIGEEESKTR